MFAPSKIRNLPAVQNRAANATCRAVLAIQRQVAGRRGTRRRILWQAENQSLERHQLLPWGRARLGEKKLRDEKAACIASKSLGNAAGCLKRSNSILLDCCSRLDGKHGLGIGGPIQVSQAADRLDGLDR
jgi:hypothetical protein